MGKITEEDLPGVVKDLAREKWFKAKELARKNALRRKQVEEEIFGIDEDMLKIPETDSLIEYPKYNPFKKKPSGFWI